MQRLIDEIARVSQREIAEITPTMSLISDLNFDSFDLFELSIFCIDTFGVDFDSDDAKSFVTVADWYEGIINAIPKVPFIGWTPYFDWYRAREIDRLIAKLRDAGFPVPKTCGALIKPERRQHMIDQLNGEIGRKMPAIIAQQTLPIPLRQPNDEPELMHITSETIAAARADVQRMHRAIGVITTAVPDNRMEPVQPSETLESLGIKYLHQRNTLMYALNKAFDFQIDNTESIRWNTVQDILNTVDRLQIRQALQEYHSDAADEFRRELPIFEAQESLSFAHLDVVHRLRQLEWCPDEQPDMMFRAVELGGEAGEALNVVKKLERERKGWRGSRATVDQLADEIGDVVHCAYLLARAAGIDFEAAVINKFNKTSEANKLNVFIR